MIHPKKTKPALWTTLPGQKPALPKKPMKTRKVVKKGVKKAGSALKKKPAKALWVNISMSKSEWDAFAARKWTNGVPPMKFPTASDGGAVVSLKRAGVIEGTVVFVPRKRIAMRSKAMAAKMRHYRSLREHFMAAHPHCQCPTGDCKRGLHASTEVHHTRGRAGALLLDTRYWRAVCRPAHNWIGANPTTARQLGYIGPWGKVDK